MCTVTYLPLGNTNFILTSNRDETPLRKTLPPKIYLENGVEMTYPKDELAGGTWIGKSAKNRIVCLLNGAYEKHHRDNYYKMSRGVIVKKILSADNAVTYIDAFDFNQIEPFTLILVEWNKAIETYELVWDGTAKYFKKLTQKPHIWSSSPLYTNEMKQLREEWFSNWLLKNKELTQEKIVQFHKREDLGDSEISLKMKRNFVETVSITSVEKQQKKVAMYYLDFLTNETKRI